MSVAAAIPCTRLDGAMSSTAVMYCDCEHNAVSASEWLRLLLLQVLLSDDEIDYMLMPARIVYSK